MMRKSEPPVMRAVAPGEFKITADETELIQIYRQVPLDERITIKGYLEDTLRDTLQDQKSKQPALRLISGGA